MCAYNEQARIGRAIYEILTTIYPCEIELIVVDDGSTDATAAIVEQFDDSRIILRRHEQNLGKGASLMTAARAATGTHILPFDADLEYSSDDIPRLIEPLIMRGYEVVYGVRLFGFNTVYRSYRYALGNHLLTTTTNVLFDAKLSDLHTCLKLMPRELFTTLRLRESGFGLDTEVTATLLRLGMRPFEVPVSYYSRSHAQGKKINWRDAFACICVLLRLRMTRSSRLRLPVPDELAGNERPGIELAGSERPGSELAGSERPGSELAGSERPGIELPGIELAGNGRPENELPGNELTGSKQPGSKQLQGAIDGWGRPRPAELAAVNRVSLNGHGEAKEEEDAAVSG